MGDNGRWAPPKRAEAVVRKEVSVLLPMPPSYLQVAGTLPPVTVDVADLDQDDIEELAIAWGGALWQHALRRREERASQ